MTALRKNSGFTLIETVISLLILVVFSVSVFSLLANTTLASNKIKASSAKLQEARQAIDFLTRYIKICDEFQLSVVNDSYANGYTRYSKASAVDFYGRLDTFKFNIINNTSEIKIFEFKRNYKSLGYNVLAFGGKDIDNYRLQVLSEKLEEIYIHVDAQTKILTITVHMDDSESLVLTQKINMSYKKDTLISDKLIE